MKKRFCTIFGDFISRKHGQKCCVYGQNGKPLTKQVVDRFITSFKEQSLLEVSKLKDISDYERQLKLINWEPNSDYTTIYRVFYFKNVFSLCDFIRDLYDLDLNTDSMQIPNISVRNQDIFKIELTSPKLNGLSYKDLKLASSINSMNFSKYLLIPIKNEDDYRQEVRKFGFEEENRKIFEDLKKSERSTLVNKYDSVEYKQVNENKKL